MMKKKRKKQRYFRENLLTHISGRSYSNLEWGLPCMDANATANLLLDITEVQMRKNQLCCSCHYTHSICTLHVFLVHKAHYHVYSGAALLNVVHYSNLKGYHEH